METTQAETICLEVVVNKRKWFIMFAYRPESINRTTFFDEVAITLATAVTQYDNILLAGDLNVDMDIPADDAKGYLSDLCDIYNLENLINVKTCMATSNGSSLDVLLTNKNSYFKKQMLSKQVLVITTKWCQHF